VLLSLLELKQLLSLPLLLQLLLLLLLLLFFLLQLLPLVLSLLLFLLLIIVLHLSMYATLLSWLESDDEDAIVLLIIAVVHHRLLVDDPDLVKHANTWSTMRPSNGTLHDLHLALPIQVSLLMGSQVAALRESLVTARIGTQVGLLSCVGSQMSPQVEIQREPLATELTLEWFLSLNK
jgi:hypothetical protein